VPRRQSWRRMASAPRCPAFGAQALFVGQPLPVVQAAVVGQAFQPAWAPLTRRLLSPDAAAPRGASRQACHAGGHAGRATHTVLVRSFQSPSVRQVEQPATACHAGRSRKARNLACHTRCSRGARSLAGGRRVPSSVPFSTQSCPPLRGASRQACHAGGHADRATHTVLVRSFPSPSVRQVEQPATACHAGRSRGARNLACHTRCSRGARSLACHAASLGGGWLLPLVAPLLGRKLSLWASLFLWCRPLLWGRLFSLRRAFQPAWAPLTRRLLSPDAAAPRGASREACHAGGHADRATQS